MTDWKAFMSDTRNQQRALNKTIPDTTRGFAALSAAVKDNGVLGLKEKEFVALAISVAERCDPCIAFHVAALQRAGGTREELGDVLAMCIQMGGGPAIMYAGKALDCWDQLAASD